MVIYDIYFSKQAEKDKKLLKQSGLENKTKALLDIIQRNPYQNPPPLEKLSGANNLFSRRINKVHRVVYEVNKEEKIIRIIQMFSHYENM